MFAGTLLKKRRIRQTPNIIETSFLHQRGKAFLTYELSVLLGVTAGPTVGGIIVDKHPWPVTFWWTIGPLAIAALLVLLFLGESGFDRERKESTNPKPPSDFIPNRIVTFFPGNHAVKPMSVSHLVSKICHQLPVRSKLIAVETLRPSFHHWDLTRRIGRRVLRLPNLRLHHRAQRTVGYIPTNSTGRWRIWLLPSSKCHV